MLYSTCITEEKGASHLTMNGREPMVCLYHLVVWLKRMRRIVDLQYRV